MRSFMENEAFEPVAPLILTTVHEQTGGRDVTRVVAVDASTLAGPDDDSIPDKWRKPVLLGLGLLFAGIAVAWIYVGEGSAPVLMFGGMGALLLLAGAMPSGSGSKVAPNWTPAFVSAVALLLCGLNWMEWSGGGSLGAILLSGFTVLFLGVAVLGIWQQRQVRRVSQFVHDSAPETSAPPPPATPDPGLPRAAPPLRIDIYTQDELPPLTGYHAPVTAEANIVGHPPQPILYLYNFFSQESLERKIHGNWRRFGPIFFLGSPADIGTEHTFSRDLAGAVTAQLIESVAEFDTRFAAASTTPLPPGDKDLIGISRLSGGYPQHLFLCNKSCWRHGVDVLFRAAGSVLLDASGYSAARAGLNWEIGQIIDRTATDRFVVIVDSETDQDALAAAFRTAWAAMRSDSPNNRADAWPVRWVVLDGLNSDGLDPRGEEPPPEADPDGLYPKMGLVAKVLTAAHYGRALADDKIYALLTEGVPHQ